MNIIEGMLDKYVLPNMHVQGYINSRYKKDGFQIVPDTLFTHVLKDTYYTHNGFKYAICDQLNTIAEAETEYKFPDIRSTDIVLDIGANIGGFSIPVSRKVKYVYAVEPIFDEIFQRNINLNNVHNVRVMCVGLGEYNRKAVRYGNRMRFVSTLPLGLIVKMCGKVDILKLDCDDVDAEMSIRSSELIGIRCIAAEIHHFNGMGSMKNFLRALDYAKFEYTIQSGPRTSIVHAERQHEIHEV